MQTNPAAAARSRRSFGAPPCCGFASATRTHILGDDQETSGPPSLAATAIWPTYQAPAPNAAGRRSNVAMSAGRGPGWQIPDARRAVIWCDRRKLHHSDVSPFGDVG